MYRVLQLYGFKDVGMTQVIARTPLPGGVSVQSLCAGDPNADDPVRPETAVSSACELLRQRQTRPPWVVASSGATEAFMVARHGASVAMVSVTRKTLSDAEAVAPKPL